MHAGLYDIHIEMKHIPLLPWEPPPVACHQLCATDIMTRKIQCFRRLQKVGSCSDGKCVWLAAMLCHDGCLMLQGKVVLTAAHSRLVMSTPCWPTASTTPSLSSHGKHRSCLGFAPMSNLGARPNASEEGLATFEGQILRSKLVVLLKHKAFGPKIDNRVDAKELVGPVTLRRSRQGVDAFFRHPS